MGRVQDRLIYVVAAMGDPEYGGATHRFGTTRRLRSAAQRVQRDGVDKIVLLGDLSHNGRPEEMVSAIHTIQSVTDTPIDTITGNRDIMLMNALEAAACIETTGARVLDNRLVIEDADGLNIAFIGMNGSIRREDLEGLRAKGLDKVNWTPYMHRITQELYSNTVATHLQTVETDSTIDQLVFWSHIPVDVHQQPEYVRDRGVLEVHPDIGETVRRSAKVVAMGSGHVHSESGYWATLPKWNRTREGIRTLSTTVETALQQRWPLFEYILFTEGHVATPVTGRQLRRLRDGDLTFDAFFKTKVA